MKQKSPISPATVAAGNPQGLAVSPDGANVYVSDGAGDRVSQYDVGPGGGLSPKSPATVAAGVFPRAVVVSPQRVPTNKEQCRHGGWKQFGFKNQGCCIAFVNHRR